MDSIDQQQAIDSLSQVAAFEYPSLPMEVLQTDSAEMTAEITETFLNLPKSQMTPDILYASNMDWMTYLVLGMLALIAFLWYFVPERLSSVFYLPEAGKKTRSKDSAQYSPGLVISSILTLNFFLAFSMFSYFVVNRHAPYLIKDFTSTMVLAGIGTIIFLIYLFRFLAIGFTGILFNSMPASKLQNRVYANANNLLGILLLPLLFFLANWNEPKLLIAGIILVISAQVLKWYSTFFIVISIPGILLFHFILYLCALELIPVVVLIRLLNSSLA